MRTRSIHAVASVAVVVVAVAAGVAGCADSSSSAGPPSVSPSPSSAPASTTARVTAPASSAGPTRRPGEGEGAFVYRTQCAGCHGARGEGELGPALVGIASRMTEAEEVARVRAGGGRMPAFAPGLTDQEIAAVVRHTRDELG